MRFIDLTAHQPQANLAALDLSHQAMLSLTVARTRMRACFWRRPRAGLEQVLRDRAGGEEQFACHRRFMAVTSREPPGAGRVCVERSRRGFWPRR